MKIKRLETGRNKFEKFKLKLVALWWFLTRKNYHLLGTTDPYTEGGSE